MGARLKWSYLEVAGPDAVCVPFVAPAARGAAPSPSPGTLDPMAAAQPDLATDPHAQSARSDGYLHGGFRRRAWTR
jgi:hypothetical protein